MVLPVRDRLPTRRTAWVNHLLLLANLVAFVAFHPWATTDECEQYAFFLEYAAIPAEINQGEPLDAAEVAQATPPECAIEPVVDKPVYLAIFTAMFMHAGWWHLLGNLLFLWIFGDNVEDRLGHLRYLGFYLISGALATVVFVVPAGDAAVTLVGASGAIAAILGAYFVMFPRSRITVIVLPLWFLPFRLPAFLVLGFWLLTQLAQVEVGGMAGGGVAYLAHAAGFIVGLLGALLFARRRPRLA
ncbi:MAG TPA: rhomboid family intramembrane serine protease [Egibacteraceae bacterium]|nr:rhomboid family intramembrane serine protease [Egibacteraceae bacterium]